MAASSVTIIVASLLLTLLVPLSLGAESNDCIVADKFIPTSRTNFFVNLHEYNCPQRESGTADEPDEEREARQEEMRIIREGSNLVFICAVGGRHDPAIDALIFDNEKPVLFIFQKKSTATNELGQMTIILGTYFTEFDVSRDDLRLLRRVLHNNVPWLTKEAYVADAFGGAIGYLFVSSDSWKKTVSMHNSFPSAFLNIHAFVTMHFRERIDEAINHAQKIPDEMIHIDPRRILQDIRDNRLSGASDM
jgi:hypothetical protein